MFCRFWTFQSPKPSLPATYVETIGYELKWRILTHRMPESLYVGSVLDATEGVEYAPAPIIVHCCRRRYCRNGNITQTGQKIHFGQCYNGCLQ